MKTRALSLIGASLTALCAGCMNTQVSILFNSDPQAATLYLDNNCYGPCPVELKYNFSREDKRNGYVKTGPAGVRWPSGAKKEYRSVSINLRNGQDTKLQEVTFTRPSDFPNIDVDVNYAIHRERMDREDQRDAERNHRKWERDMDNLNQNLMILNNMNRNK